MATNRLLRLAVILLFLIFSVTADDTAVMSKLSASISPVPSTWKLNGNSYCDWQGISCDNNKRVTSINISSNSLTGTLPPDLNSLSQLKTLAIQGNSFNGPLPSLASLTLLKEVYLEGNNFTSIPINFFLGLINLQKFSISGNWNLSPWCVPNDLTVSTNLQTFEASNANIIGSIPDFFDKFPSLQDLRLSYNNLTGELPASLGGSEIVNLWLNNQDQGLSGGLDVLSSMSRLSRVWLKGNAFTGAIPDLSKCNGLFDLQLGDNQLTGVVPVSLMGLPKLVNVTLQNNKLQGPLPVFGSDVRVELGSSTNSFCLATPGDCDPQVTALLEVARDLGYPISLAESWKGNNACEGGWDFVICDPSGKNVTLVNFGKLGFSGNISPSFANLTLLKTLLLNDNNLTGSIPEILTSLPNLQLFDVSNNNLSGTIPAFPSKVKVVLDYNPFIGIDVASGNTNQPAGSSSNSSDSGPRSPGKSKRSSGSVGMVIGILTSVLVFVGIVLFALYKYVKNRYPKFGRAGSPGNGKELVKKSEIRSSSNGFKVPNEIHSGMPVFERGNVMISYQVLKQVTDNFSDNNVLGKGGFGVVYKGELHDGTRIAVKRMESSVKGAKGMKEFQAEIGVLTKVRHRHLVALLGYCVNEHERLLVYEYMPQGTLSQHLFNWSVHQCPPLIWKQRVSIALDVGRGVEYLHTLAQQSFIHRDLKPANILLDDDMRAKVADFGLVKNAPDGKYSIETRLAGTFGYLAPEHAATGRVTTKVDVFAFGVVLMQLITGRKALDGSMPYERCQLVTWFRKVPVCKENMVKFIDQVLDTDDSETLESILKVAELARHCTTPEPFQRPNMGYVVGVLAHLVEEWNPSRHEQDKTYGHKHHMSLPEMLQDDEATSRMPNLIRLSSF